MFVDCQNKVGKPVKDDVMQSTKFSDPGGRDAIFCLACT